jgi:arylsulfatase A-like enzyme
MRPNGEPRQRPKPKTVERMSNLYDAEIRYMDTAIGELLAALGEAGLLENSVVAFVADHGEHFGEGGYYFGHWDVLDETARVPMVIAHADGRHRGSVVEQSVGTIDLVPTLLSWMGIETPLAFDGVDLTPLIRGDPVPPRAFYTEQFEYFPVRAARSGPWMLRQQAQRDQPVGQGQQRLLRRTSRDLDSSPPPPDVLARLSRALDALARPSSHHESESLAVPDAARARLRALGYTNEASAAEP